MRSLASQCGHAPKILGTIEGSIDMERRLHKALRQGRTFGEFYRRRGLVKKLLDDLASCGGHGEATWLPIWLMTLAETGGDMRLFFAAERMMPGADGETAQPLEDWLASLVRTGMVETVTISGQRVIPQSEMRRVMQFLEAGDE